MTALTKLGFFALTTASLLTSCKEPNVNPDGEAIKPTTTPDVFLRYDITSDNKTAFEFPPVSMRSPQDNNQTIVSNLNDINISDKSGFELKTLLQTPSSSYRAVKISFDNVKEGLSPLTNPSAKQFSTSVFPVVADRFVATVEIVDGNPLPKALAVAADGTVQSVNAKGFKFYATGITGAPAQEYLGKPIVTAIKDGMANEESSSIKGKHVMNIQNLANVNLKIATP